MQDSDGSARRQLEQRVQRALGLHIRTWSALCGGSNNRLFRLDTVEAVPLVAKFYVRELPEDALRLNTGDFGVHNLLTPPHGESIVVDFEAAGWDDPARLVMGFVAHGGARA